MKLAQWYDLSGFLAHNLSVSDKASMLASIELRVPLLDNLLLQQGLSLSSNDLIKKRKLKYPLQNILSKRLPKRLVKRPKVGFNPPIDSLINNLGRATLRQEMNALSHFIDIKRTIPLLRNILAYRKTIPINCGNCFILVVGLNLMLHKVKVMDE